MYLLPPLNSSNPFSTNLTQDIFEESYHSMALFCLEFSISAHLSLEWAPNPSFTWPSNACIFSTKCMPASLTVHHFHTLLLYFINTSFTQLYCNEPFRPQGLCISCFSFWKIFPFSHSAKTHRWDLSIWFSALQLLFLLFLKIGLLI